MIKMEKKTIKDNSSVLQIFKLFIQLKGDFAMDGGKQVVDAVFSSRGQFKPFCLTPIGLVHERLKNASDSFHCPVVLWWGNPDSAGLCKKKQVSIFPQITKWIR